MWPPARTWWWLFRMGPSPFSRFPRDCQTTCGGKWTASRFSAASSTSPPPLWPCSTHGRERWSSRQRTTSCACTLFRRMAISGSPASFYPPSRFFRCRVIVSDPPSTVRCSPWGRGMVLSTLLRRKHWNLWTFFASTGRRTVAASQSRYPRKVFS